MSSVEQLSPENETLERRNLKSILKKLSASSRTGSSETSATSTPDREAATAELRKLMRAQTIEGYAARHSKLSKSVTFNKYTLQSPPSEHTASNYPPLSESQDQPSLPPPNKLSFRPVGSAGGVLQMVPRPREAGCLGDLLSGVGEVIKVGLVSKTPPPPSRRLLCGAPVLIGHTLLSLDFQWTSFVTARARCHCTRRRTALLKLPVRDRDRGATTARQRVR